jgi:hypothetical protein
MIKDRGVRPELIAGRLRAVEGHGGLNFLRAPVVRAFACECKVTLVNRLWISRCPL